MATAYVITDAGPGYIKVIGNPEGEHALACELVGTSLARWLGLPTLDWHILTLDDTDTFSLPGRRRAKPGPAFITRAIRAHPWGGKAATLKIVENSDDIARLVVLDTWLLNPDRHPRIPPTAAVRKPNRDNVLLTREGAAPKRLRLVAMDFSHAFTAGGELTKRLSQIGRVQDEGVFGLYDEFRPFVKQEIMVATAARLRQMSESAARRIISLIPREWDVPPAARDALAELVYGRARWLADTITDRLSPLCFPQREFDFPRPGGESLEEGP